MKNILMYRPIISTRQEDLTALEPMRRETRTLPGSFEVSLPYRPRAESILRDKAYVLQSLLHLGKDLVVTDGRWNKTLGDSTSRNPWVIKNGGFSHHQEEYDVCLTFLR